MSFFPNEAYYEAKYEAEQEKEAVERKISIIVMCVGLFLFFTILIILT